MDLTSEQLSELRDWASEGKTLSEIQKRMESNWNLRMTYMQLRFLMDDYSIELCEPKKDKIIEEKTDLDQSKKPELPAEESEEIAPDAGVTVEADLIARPGSVLSGSVVFGDGVKAKWYLDQFGRLSLDGVDKSYRPSSEDVQTFQAELQKILQKKGY